MYTKGFWSIFFFSVNLNVSLKNDENVHEGLKISRLKRVMALKFCTLLEKNIKIAQILKKWPSRLVNSKNRKWSTDNSFRSILWLL